MTDRTEYSRQWMRKKRKKKAILDALKKLERLIKDEDERPTDTTPT